MARLSEDINTARHAAFHIARTGAEQIAATSSLTSAALTVAYTTDDPVFVADGAVTIADGDSITAVESLAELLELLDDVNKRTTDLATLRTQINLAKATGVDSCTASPGMTAAKSPITFTFTTDAPAITPNNAVIVADGDAVTAANIHEAVVELHAEMVLQYNDLDAIIRRFNTFVSGNFNEAKSLGQCPALTSTANPIAWTFTTDDPAITPGGSTTINDGDNASAATRFDLCYELDDQVTKQRADIATLRTTLNAMLANAGIVV